MKSEITINGKVCISQASAGRLIGVQRQRIGQLLDSQRLNSYYQKGSTNRLVSKEEVLNLEDLPRGRPQNHPEFKKGTPVIVNNAKHSNVKGKIARPYGDKVEVKIRSGKIWASVDDVTLA